ncbi:hypothetical protein W02_30250 [Nitrospira sp. KM1]|uniref:small ribosomal subunit Rsm22 family protein n=1 Tax=Nitrospira sp. KM1 TaxID=1936990 RepID=UPI0013A73EBD|nr:small ribosomal subunit Rsm22 family protein [Nitrospira sp. KM1]BCA55885.1 hypothetical protein W02_30250 [Nitrospira sp. KM1]
MKHLSRLFTKDRQSLLKNYLDDPARASAYLKYFFPINLSKIQLLLDELPADTFTSDRSEGLSVLDVGSGPGTAAIAVLDWLVQNYPERTNGLSVVAVDSSSGALIQSRRILEGYCREAGLEGVRFTDHRDDVEQSMRHVSGSALEQHGPYDLVILANCLNELGTGLPDPTTIQTTIVANALALMKPHGTVMIVEPALKTTSRALHRVRDRLLDERHCTVYSPCLHEGHCPALVHPDDWCHEERRWEAPAAIQWIDRGVGFIKDALKFSYLLLRTDGRTIVKRSPDVFRIVSEMRKMKGDTRAWLCNELGRIELGRLDRMRSESNATWDECERGTIAEIKGAHRKGGSKLERIPAEGTVAIVRRTDSPINRTS